MPGWSNPHRPRMERITIIRRAGRTNAHRPRAPRDVSRGWNMGGGCRAKRDGGWPESLRNHTYSPLSSRAKRGDPVNKKVLRANARRHIALDCHSRTTTFSTLIVLLRNDSDICPARMHGHYLHSILYTLHSDKKRGHGPVFFI